MSAQPQASHSFSVSSRLRGVRVVGHVFWWIFVVSELLTERPIVGMPRRYADYVAVDDGWTAYTPLTPSDGFVAVNVLSTASLIALVVTVAAAFVEAVACRRWVAGVVTVLAPIIGALIVIVGSAARYSGVWDDVQLRPVLAAGVVLVGVAVREVWARGCAPAAVAARRP